MILVCAFLMLCPGRFEKKLISMLAVSYMVIAIANGGDFSIDFRREYDCIIGDAQKYAENIRADAEKYKETVMSEKLEGIEDIENTE